MSTVGLKKSLRNLNKDFAAKFAHKRIRVTGTLFYPMGGWQNVTPVRMDFSKVEVVESKMPMSKQ